MKGTRTGHCESGRVRLPEFRPALPAFGLLGACSSGCRDWSAVKSDSKRRLRHWSVRWGWFGSDFALIYFSLLQRQLWPGLLGLGVWLLLTLAGNSWVAHQLAGTREAPFLEFRLDEVEPLDVAVVLGGGSATRLNGEVQLSSSGDRIATAARLYHDERVGHIVCTGSQPIRVSEQDLPPREEGARLLEDLAVPGSVIDQLRREKHVGGNGKPETVTIRPPRLETNRAG